MMPQPYNYFITLLLLLLVTKSHVNNSDPEYLIRDPRRGLGENLSALDVSTAVEIQVRSLKRVLEEIIYCSTK